jgi:hypothetical protein
MSASRDWLASLDPDIAPSVDVLDVAGIETFESYKHTEGHCFLEPTMRFCGETARASVPPLWLYGANCRDGTRSYWQVSRAGEPKAPTGSGRSTCLLFADLAQRATVRARAPVRRADFLSTRTFVVVVVDVPLAPCLRADRVVRGYTSH